MFQIFRMPRLRKSSIPSLLTRTTNDITQLQMALTMGLQVITQGPIMAIWAITKIADKNGNWLLALLVAVAATSHSYALPLDNGHC
ncbi:Multidrug resistance ABC transporter ATP-binding and permease protein [Streptococcus thermophilus CNCM I-1630]|nr:Multidrug resistance ABC transporter ATP-binding and permease protein [Streptococcus thermophilus CNCM I-1630]